MPRLVLLFSFKRGLSSLMSFSTNRTICSILSRSSGMFSFTTLIRDKGLNGFSLSLSHFTAPCGWQKLNGHRPFLMQNHLPSCIPFASRSLKFDLDI